MDLKLNNQWALILLLCVFSATGFAQYENRPGDKDYKDGEQFDKFYKRRKNIGAWQINQLKEGALVVVLKTNRLLVNALLKNGDTLLAKRKELEMAAININTIKAYQVNYNFSKLYFIYIAGIDSLLKGVRQNIFVDSTLKVNPTIVMPEKFYLLAERDYAVNSTIGFVKEDSAKLVKEKGDGTKEMAIVVKNKYRQQLKAPFPYKAANRSDLNTYYSVTVQINGIPVVLNIKKFIRLAPKDPYEINGTKVYLKISKYEIYQRIALSVSNFNYALLDYYYKNANRDVWRTNPELRPYLY